MPRQDKHARDLLSKPSFRHLIGRKSDFLLTAPRANGPDDEAFLTPRHGPARRLFFSTFSRNSRPQTRFGNDIVMESSAVASKHALAAPSAYRRMSFALASDRRKAARGADRRPPSRRAIGRRRSQKDRRRDGRGEGDRSRVLPAPRARRLGGRREPSNGSKDAADGVIASIVDAGGVAGLSRGRLPRGGRRRHVRRDRRLGARRRRRRRGAGQQRGSP